MPRSKAARKNQKNVTEAGPARIFKVTRGGKQKNYEVTPRFGYFIRSLKGTENLSQVNALVENGIASKEIQPIIEYLELKVPDIAKAAAVSPSTVSRWKADTSIGVAGSNQFFRIDEVTAEHARVGELGEITIVMLAGGCFVADERE